MIKYLLFLLIPSLLFAFNPYTNADLDKVETDFVTAINQSPQILREPLAVDYLNQLGKRLTDASGMSPATFFIVNSPEINAFAGPGGYIGLHTSLLLTTQNEDELAAVMAHELAHVRLHHLYDMIEHQKLMQIPTIASLLAAMALGTIDPNLSSGALAATLTASAQHAINYTRTHEREADRIGIQMLQKAGFNPYGMASFFRKMQMQTRYYDLANMPAILRSHPLDEERIAEVENRLTHAPHTFQPQENYALFQALIRSKVTNTMKPLIEYYQKNFNHSSPVQQYGLALAYLENNHFLEAKKLLLPLDTHFKGEPFYVIALSRVELGLHHHKEAIALLNALETARPHHLPTLLALADALIADGQSKTARKHLTKAFRHYPSDIKLCQALAQAEAQDKRPAYAYFIEAECETLQGHPKLAIQRLKIAKKEAQQDTYLRDRIDAQLEALKD